MYIIFPCIMFFLVICALLMFWRRKCIIRKICCMSVKEKLCRLNELVNPFGFEYLLSQDIFTSRKDAWQRDFGYCHLYDKSADLFMASTLVQRLGSTGQTALFPGGIGTLLCSTPCRTTICRSSHTPCIRDPVHCTGSHSVTGG